MIAFESTSHIFFEKASKNSFFLIIELKISEIICNLMKNQLKKPKKYLKKWGFCYV